MLISQFAKRPLPARRQVKEIPWLDIARRAHQTPATSVAGVVVNFFAD